MISTYIRRNAIDGCCKIPSYKKVLSVVPRVWKRLIVTFIWTLVLLFGYGVLCVAVIFIVAVLFAFISQGSDFVINVVTWVGVVGFFAGVIYLSCVWHLASIVTVLKEGYGLMAMRKSLQLIKGKQLVAFCLFIVFCDGLFKRVGVWAVGGTWCG
ncbi:hypothetical protein L7F22_044345 [Adiantum nelumboides]|nr:hypothetical protein [Adiantum nelumboides]